MRVGSPGLMCSTNYFPLDVQELRHKRLSKTNYMLGIEVGALHTLSHCFLIIPSIVDVIVRKLRVREVKKPVQVHMVSSRPRI